MYWKSVIVVAVAAIGTLYLIQNKEAVVKFQTLINTDLEKVYGFWKDVSNLKIVHPFVQTIEKTKQTTKDEEAGTILIETFRVEERLDYLPVNMHFTFTRETRKVGGRYIMEYSSNLMGGLLNLNTTYVFSRVDDGITKVEEFSHIEVLRMLEAFVVMQMNKAHQDVLDKSKELLENNLKM